MRLDVFCVEKKLIITRSQALQEIKRGNVLVNKIVITKAGFMVNESKDIIEIINIPDYFSKGYLKIKSFVEEIEFSFQDKVVLDVGSSTGGFTYYALRQDAKKVICYDTGFNQLHESLRLNPKIELHEKTNILTSSSREVDIVLVDVSFTSIIPILKHISLYSNEFIVLIKPQFEVGKIYLKNGIVKDNKLIQEVITNVTNVIISLNFEIIKISNCSHKAKDANDEFFCYFRRKKI
jgi:23S rRNA (cytidine1920-2'-O)/16S rRNA (cytidine1409-2'-O)-methyltransferase